MRRTGGRGYFNWDKVNRAEKHGREKRFTERAKEFRLPAPVRQPRLTKAEMARELQEALVNTAKEQKKGK